MIDTLPCKVPFCDKLDSPCCCCFCYCCCCRHLFLPLVFLAFFAPTDDAFAKLDAGFVEYILSPENYETLREILSYHISYVGEIAYGEFTSSTLSTLQGSDVNIVVTTTTGTASNTTIISVEDAKVIQPHDITAYNARIHAIDTVLIPSTVNIPRDIVSILYESNKSPSLIGYLELAQLSSRLRQGGPFTLFAPSEDAFEIIVSQAREGAQVNVDALKSVLLYHIAPQLITMDNLLNGDVTEAVTLHGAPLTFVVKTITDGSGGSVISINDDSAYIITKSSNMLGRNGVVHVIDAVLIPPFTVTEKPTMAPGGGSGGTIMTLPPTVPDDSTSSAMSTAFVQYSNILFTTTTVCWLLRLL